MSGAIGFSLDVDDTGKISGTYSAAFGGSLEAIGEDTSSTASILVNAELSGTAANVDVRGESSFEIGSSIDVSGADGIDVFAGRPVSIPSSATFTRPYTSQIVPSFANCGEAIGNLSQDPDNPILFIATRTTGSKSADADLSSAVIDLLDWAEAVLAEEAPDSGALHRLVREAEEIDALVAAQEYCHPEELGSLARGGSAHDLMRSTLLEILFRFMDRAAAGEYTTADVISAFTAATRGAAFGGSAGDCVGEDDGAFGLLRTQTEDVLRARHSAAQAGDPDEVAAIEVAALQLGMDSISTPTGGE